MRLQVREIGVFRDVHPGFQLLLWTGAALFLAGAVRQANAAQVLGALLFTCGVLWSTRPAVTLFLAVPSFLLALLAVLIVNKPDSPFGTGEGRALILLASTFIFTDMLAVCAWAACRVYNLSIQRLGCSGFTLDCAGDEADKGAENSEPPPQDASPPA